MKLVSPQFRTGSRNLKEDSAKVAYPGQPENMRQIAVGYENMLDDLPIIEACDDISWELSRTQSVMKIVSDAVAGNGHLMSTENLEPGGFNRTIIAMEEPTEVGVRYFHETSSTTHYVPGVEIVVAKWGDGHTSPVHGHAPGYMHEEILSGKIRVNTYRITNMKERFVRPLRTEIVGPGVFVSDYVKPTEENATQRNTLVHNFTSIGNSVSLHYLPEHTRDGMGNGFTVEQFSYSYPLTQEDFDRIDSKQGLYSQKGDVILVRSSNVPEYGDHYIVITGHPVIKEHGMRPQDEAIMASEVDSALLDTYQMRMGLTLLKMKGRAKEAFLAFHNITFDEFGNVLFPSK